MLVVGAHGFSLYEHTRDIQKQMGNLALKLATISIASVCQVYVYKCTSHMLHVCTQYLSRYIYYSSVVYSCNQ